MHPLLGWQQLLLDCVLQRCYKIYAGYFSSVELFKSHRVYGFRFQCSGVRQFAHSLEAGRLRSQEAGSGEAFEPSSIPAFKPSSYFTDTRHLKPKLRRIKNAKINPCFGNYV
jgi:hypothetical protein